MVGRWRRGIQVVFVSGVREGKGEWRWGVILGGKAFGH